MKKLISILGGLVLSLALVTTVFAVGTNGSFELGTDPGAGVITVNAGGTDITGWTVDLGNVDYIGSFWQAADGVRSLDLNGLEKGSVSQTLTTVIGGTYTVSFDMSGNPGDCIQYPNGACSPSNKVLRVSATGATPQDFSFDTISKGNSFSDMMWEPHTYTFVAYQTSTTLTFASQIEGAFGPALDNVVITEQLPVAVATGGLRLGSPTQQISFNAFDYGDSSLDKGHVEYQNFDYPGGLHYTADVLCANVQPANHKAWFMFQIPDGFPGLSGLYVVSYVGDFGTPGTKGDQYGHAATADLTTATSWCETGFLGAAYPVTGGNAVVHK